jgi:hypothetical protein
MSNRWGVDSGRVILRDSKPFVTVSRVTGTEPVEADQFTRDVAEAMNRMENQAKPGLLQRKTYLGDGLYAGWDGMHIVLYADNGWRVYNTVYLDIDVAQSLLDYLADLGLGGKHG